MLGKIAWSFLFACTVFVAYGAFTQSYELVAARYARAQQLREGNIDRALNQPDVPPAPSIKSLETVKVN